VIATLRPVDDQRAAELMMGFHREYVRDGDAPAALARVIRTLRANSKRKSESTDWSAFQYIGTDPRARSAPPSELNALLGEGGTWR
jgi:CHAT domain-containing protein